MTTANAPIWPGASTSPSAPPGRDDAPGAEVATADDVLTTTTVGRRAQLFRLALRTATLTILTLGFYRFWMKTRLRRWYWSSVRPGGLPLEYVGEPREKLLGFFLAVCFLAFYLGIVNLVLVFGSLAILQSAGAAYALSAAALVPLIFYARYRAWRYVLGRTRWRGIRFGLEPGAWGYAARALGHGALVILTIGLWWPRFVFALERYRTDRTHYGTQTLRQGGNATMLYPAFAPLMTSVVLAAMAVAVAVADGQRGFLWLLVVLVPCALYGIVHWQVHSTRLLVGHKTAGPISLAAMPRVGRIAWIYAFGGLLLIVALLAVVVLVALMIAALSVLIWGTTTDFGAITSGRAGGPNWIIAVLGIVGYFALFLLSGTLRHVTLTLPLWRHYAETLTVDGAAALPAIRQRDRDAFAEAEGFAEALDLGAAI